MSIASLLLQPFELELKTKIPVRMLNDVLSMKELPAPIKTVKVELLKGRIKIHVQTGILFMKNISVDARIIRIELSKNKSIVRCELMGTAGGIVNKLLGLLKNKILQISVNGNMLDFDITEILLKQIPHEAAGILDKTQVHILDLEPDFLNLGIRKT